MNYLNIYVKKLRRNICRYVLRFNLKRKSPHSLKTGFNGKNIIIPFPMTITIDDVGRKKSWRMDNSDHILDDYLNLIFIGKSVGTRLMCAFMIAQFDKNNSCAKYPSTTIDGDNWDNGTEFTFQDQIMDVVKNNSAFIEYGLHGVDHRMYWDSELVPDGLGGPNKDAFAHYGEWYDAGGLKPWNKKAVKEHLKCFYEISSGYNISFPISMIPPHNAYYFNPKSDESTGFMMAEYGIKYATTDFFKIANLLPKEGLLDRVLLLHRDSGNIPHDAVGKVAEEFVNTTSIMTHFGNFYSEDSLSNRQVAEEWIQWFDIVKGSSSRYIPKNTKQLNSQWIYCKYAKLDIHNNYIIIDTSSVPQMYYDDGFVGNLLLKICLDKGMHISDAQIDDNLIVGYYEERGYAHIILPPLNRGIHKLNLKFSNDYPSIAVLNNGTYNVLSFTFGKEECSFCLETYGTQDVTIKIPRSPKEVISSNKNVIINSFLYDEELQLLTINITAINIQGNEALVIVKL
ncbi:hypothetical protein [Methanolobus sp. ZRKC5]|uniref:hypothetical protein n=1 Tax=unclassified Methanolobus TaxID=2629569 RepID=UPI00313D2032